jgi:diguanylate cyclase (GGDEF)-like protein
MNELDWLLLAVGLQQALYGAVWLVAARLVPDLRHASWHFAAFGFCGSAAMGLFSLRGTVPDWAAIGLCDLLLIQTLVHLRIASERFFRLSVNRWEHAAALAGGALTLLVAGVGPETLPLRITGMSLVLGLMIVRAVRVAQPGMRVEAGAVLAWALHGPALLLGLGALWRSLSAVLGDPIAADLLGGLRANQALALALIVMMAGVHFGYGGLMLGRLMRRLRHLSRHDALTGLLNRRAMDERLAIEWQRHLRLHEPFSLLLLDIDHFKRINDRHGHAVGDHALKALAEVLRELLRPADSAARVGGEEFLVLLPGADAPRALAVAERLRQEIARMAVPAGEPGTVVHFTVSIGVADAVAQDAGLPTLQLRADHALYRAKAEGRDRVVLAPEQAAPLTQPAAL